jgi:trk system potassium uptake protein
VIAVHIVILGCGRVGSLLAQDLDSLGHSVAVIDQDAKSFRRLGPNYSGSTVTGMGFDRQTLESAGIERAHAFAAVSSGDNTNIISARVARETYGVEHVVARIYDLGRAEVYERLGIPTVATVAWTASQMMRRLLPSGSYEEYRDPTGSMSLAEVHTHQDWIGRSTQEIEEHASARLAYLTRFGTTVFPGPDVVIQQGDVVHVLAHVDDLPRIETILGSANRVN